MTAGDRIVEEAASRLRETAGRWSAESGWKAKLAEPLAEDAEFVRKLKPSLIRARARGELPTDEAPATPAPVTPAPASAPAGGADSKPPPAGGPNPFLVLAAALALGILLAKVVDWRSHAHPRD
jgi:hypothetical protein